MDYYGKKIVVVGMGRSGLGAAKLLKRHGASVVVTDHAGSAEAQRVLCEHNIPYEATGHTEDVLRNADGLVLSPGISRNIFPVRWARERKIPVISEIELAAQFTNKPIIAITGTNGKTTSTSMMGAVLQGAGRTPLVCGNIGVSACEGLYSTSSYDVIVLEVSSFQLELIVSFRPNISVFLNLSSDHMDRYDSLEDYGRAKCRVYQNQKPEDFLIVQDRLWSQWIHKMPPLCAVLRFSCESRLDVGAWMDATAVHLSVSDQEPVTFERRHLKLQGDHNTQNYMAVGLACLLMGLSPKDVVTGLTSFAGLPHRLEFVREHRGVRFYNDSKATNVDATNAALENLESDVILIAGGQNKNMSFEDLRPKIQRHVKSMILIGETAKEMAALFEHEVPVRRAVTLPDAIHNAWDMARQGDKILLSPACASFDMFQDYCERGDVFKQCIASL